MFARSAYKCSVYSLSYTTIHQTSRSYKEQTRFKLRRTDSIFTLTTTYSYYIGVWDNVNPKSTILWQPLLAFKDLCKIIRWTGTDLFTIRATMSENVPSDMCAQEIKVKKDCPLKQRTHKITKSETRLRPGENQISMRICEFWSEYSLSAFCFAKDAKFLPANSEDSAGVGWFVSSLGLHVRGYVFSSCGS